MKKKKIEVVELNKKKEKIILAEEQPAILLFFRRYGTLLYLTLLIVSLSIVGISLISIMNNINSSKNPTIKETSVDVSLNDYKVVIPNNSLTEDKAKELFLNSGKFKSNGETILVKKVEHSKYMIKFYSDGTALRVMKDGNKTIRINPLANGDYGISSDGIISSNAAISDVTIVNTKKYDWGTVNYFSDGSAEVVNSKMDIFVRNSTDVKDNYISDNKVTYLKETKNVGNTKLNYYYDGTIEVVKNNTSYVVRSEDDLNISNNDVTFKNNNEAEIYKTVKMDDGYIVDYYTDGGAIIKEGSRTLSVRKSNSIIIKDNKIFEIVDNIYVEVSKEENGVTYYTNGSAVVDNYNGKEVYVSENSNIKFNDNGNITDINQDTEELSNESKAGNENAKTFDGTAVIKTDDYIAIVPKDRVVYDTEGKIKTIDDIETNPDKEFQITNNTNEKIKYRIVLEQSDITDVDTQYLRFQASVGEKYITPTRLDSVIWKEDNISKELKVTGTNYILGEGSLEPFDTDSINIMMWTDYDTIPNSQQNKYFYGTLRVYSWTEE